MSDWNRTGVALTKEDVKALRECDSLCMDLYDLNGERISQMRAVKEQHGTGWSGDGLTYTIPVGYSAIRYSSTYSTEPNRLGRCYAYFGNIQFSDVIRTVIGLLRVGDVVKVIWSADNNSEVIKQASMHQDTVELCVTRGKKRMVFMLTSNCSYDNSARMVQLY